MAGFHVGKLRVCIAFFMVLVVFMGGGCDPLMLEVGSDLTINQGESVQLGVTVKGGDGNYTYAWSPSTSLSDPTIPNPFAMPTASTTYTVTVRDMGGMVEVVQITVFVIPPMVTTPSVPPQSDTQPPSPPPLTANAGGNRTEPFSDINGTCVTLMGSASGGSGTNVEFRWSGGPGGDVFGEATCKLLPIGVHDLTLTVTDSRGVQATDAFTATVLVPGQSGTGLSVNSTCGSNAVRCTNEFPVAAISVSPLLIDGQVQTVTIKDREVILVEGIANPDIQINPNGRDVPKKIIVQRAGAVGPERIQLMGEIRDQFSVFLFPDNLTIEWLQDGVAFSSAPNPEVILSPGTHFIELRAEGLINDNQGGQVLLPLITEVKLIVTPAPGTLCAFAGDPIIRFFPDPAPQLQGSATGGVPPYTFSWCPSGNLSDASIAMPSLAGPGLVNNTQYVLTVMDANGSCDVSRVFVVVDFFGLAVGSCDQAPCP